MFQFVYACLPGEVVTPADLDGFVGVENGAGDGVTTVGRRIDPKVAGVPDDVAYVIVIEPPRTPTAAGLALGALADQVSRATVLVENTAGRAGAVELWTVLEAAHHPRVKVAVDIDLAQAAGQTAAVLIPTLNLRIGVIRVRTPGNDAADYARRLAGIGYDGYVVCDPPPGPDRIAAAVALAGVFRSVYPTKPAKKVVPAKPVKV